MKAFIIYGQPGSGKGTQANLLTEKVKDLIHFDTGKFCDKYVHDPSRESDKQVQHERELFDTGKLMTPSFVLNVVGEETKRLAGQGKSVVYSGSPRTLFEAFGNEMTEGLLDILKSLYGKDNIHVIHISVSAQTSINRNSARSKRNIDDPEVIKVRLVEYKERTEPILAKIKEQGYGIIEINGEPEPEEIHQNILKELKI
jgi:adenylate kinase